MDREGARRVSQGRSYRRLLLIDGVEVGVVTPRPGEGVVDRSDYSRRGSRRGCSRRRDGGAAFDVCGAQAVCAALNHACVLVALVASVAPLAVVRLAVFTACVQLARHLRKVR